ncbi:MAG: hydroxyacid dehydrogenase [Candidatus Manganitrophaceae bacterium]
MAIVFLEVEPWEQEYLMGRCPSSWQACFYPEEADRISIDQIDDAEVLSVFIYSDLDAALMGRFPALKLIATRSTGTDHIDLAFCRQKGIAVSNVPTYGANTVAEHTFALILSLSRKIYPARARTLRGDFSFRGLRGFDLMGKTLGVVGAGQIGRHVIRIASGFQMRVLAYDLKPDPPLAERLGFEFADLDTLLLQSDIVSLHLPLIPQTHHLIGKREFEKMKRGAFLINTARGGLVDTDALLWALEEGIVGGAGLDVLEEEEAVREERELLSSRFNEEKLKAVVRNHILLQREDVLITPHIAFNSQEAVERIMQTTVDNISGFLEGKPRNRVA